MGAARCICKTNAKLAINTERESNTVTKFREALSFSAFLVIFFAFAKSDIALASSDIVRLRLTVIFYSPPKLAKRISLAKGE